MTDTITVAAATAWLEAYADVVDAQRDHLTELDSAIGDADHGANMSRGTRAAVDKVLADQPAHLDGLLKAVGMTLVSTVGGTSGPLYGTFFLRLAAALGHEGEADPATLAAGLRAGLDGVIARGKAEAGDKTMIDAMDPAVAAFERAVTGGSVLGAAASAAADAADAGRDATEPLIARKGRASYLGERSAGHIDPGAASTALLFRSLAEALAA
ncbi:dihydroxyacetone kinase subunit DhaL [Microbacterium karelineae]|uniref:dihydroxyacetone kinase subunit DhaL n=1 Tax=Microbacterium karelineae TaxID=2654283 RepID=UPI0012EA3CBD|nr:dihydroxyacetone kinase subunit DhaL [Microbacterium karelineae]